MPPFGILRYIIGHFEHLAWPICSRCRSSISYFFRIENISCSSKSSVISSCSVDCYFSVVMTLMVVLLMTVIMVTVVVVVVPQLSFQHSFQIISRPCSGSFSLFLSRIYLWPSFFISNHLNIIKMIISCHNLQFFIFCQLSFRPSGARKHATYNC